MPSPATTAMPEIPLAGDPLTEALQHLRMDGVFYCRSELQAPWGLDLPPMSDCLFFHVVISGSCWLSVSGEEPVRLSAGQVAVLPQAVGHVMVDAPGSDACSIFDIPHDYLSPHYANIRHGGDGTGEGRRVDLVCGAVRFGHPAARSLIDALPDLITVDPTDPDSGDWSWLAALLQLMAAETSHPRPGGEAVVTRLCDILVIQAVRSWLDHSSDACHGWIGALRDPRIGHAIASIHRDPGRDWTVAGLAEEVAMSRSSFAAHFTDLVGEGAMQYVTRWRMQVATDLLRSEQLTNSQIAGRLGYSSEAAFCRAFKRETGTSPGVVKRRGPVEVVVPA